MYFYSYYYPYYNPPPIPPNIENAINSFNNKIFFYFIGLSILWIMGHIPLIHAYSISLYERTEEGIVGGGAGTGYIFFFVTTIFGIIILLGLYIKIKGEMNKYKWYPNMLIQKNNKDYSYISFILLLISYGTSVVGCIGFFYSHPKILLINVTLTHIIPFTFSLIGILLVNKSKPNINNK